MVRAGTAVALACAGVVVALAVPRRRRPAWHSVTVLAERSGIDVAAGPLARIHGLEVRLERAPGDRGTEIHARYGRAVAPGRSQALRAALRDTKSLAETGGVVRVHPRPHGRRRRTPWGLAQDAVERRAKGLGLS